MTQKLSSRRDFGELRFVEHPHARGCERPVSTKPQQKLGRQGVVRNFKRDGPVDFANRPILGEHLATRAFDRPPEIWPPDSRIVQLSESLQP